MPSPEASLFRTAYEFRVTRAERVFPFVSATSPNVLTEKACEDAAQGLRGLEVICDVADDTLVLLCCLGESKAISLFLHNCSFGCLFSVECVSCRFCVGMSMKKNNRRPETPASLPWRRETTRHRINMAENVLVGVIEKVKPNMANRIHCRNFCATKCCYIAHFQIDSLNGKKRVMV